MEIRFLEGRETRSIDVVEGSEGSVPIDVIVPHLKFASLQLGDSSKRVKAYNPRVSTVSP
jgi:hypothetical protein